MSQSEAKAHLKGTWSFTPVGSKLLVCEPHLLATVQRLQARNQRSPSQARRETTSQPAA